MSKRKTKDLHYRGNEMQITDEQIKAALKAYPFPNDPGLNWGNAILDHLGFDEQLDQPDCWSEAAERFGQTNVLRLVELAETGDVASTAFDLFCLEIAPLDWTMIQIERGIGDVAIAASRLANFASPEWAMEQIERGIGSVAEAACEMCLTERAPQQWARRQIERGIGDVAISAYLMRQRRCASTEWATEQIERSIGSVSIAALWMHEDGYVSKEWRDKVLEDL